MSIFLNRQKADYTRTLQKGISFVRGLGSGLTDYTGSREENLRRLKNEIETADALVIGAGAGLSTAAGLTYSGERFDRYFFDFKEHYGIRDMYSGGFYPFRDEETRWAWWARHIYFNRYIDAPKMVYRDLLSLIRNRDYFVITTNVDHQFQRAGFDKERLFYTQGDYGLFQSAEGRIKKTYDNEEWVRKAMDAQGFIPDVNGVFQVPEDRLLRMRIPRELIPVCPDDGGPVSMNLRSDDTFVEDEGWHEAADRYAAFLQAHEREHVLYLELGVGGNTPMIIKYPFWAMTSKNPNAVYACLNYDEAVCPVQLKEQSICLDGDSGEVLKELKTEKTEEHGTVQLRTERMILRKYRPEDADALYRNFGTDPEMVRYSGWNPYETPEMARETVARFMDSYHDGHSYSWVMDQEDALLGTIGAYDYKDGRIEVGFSIARDYWGRGYATEALKAVLSYLTKNEDIPCVTAWCAAENTGSRRVLEKAGMRLVRIEKDSLTIGDRTYDRLIFEYTGRPEGAVR